MKKYDRTAMSSVGNGTLSFFYRTVLGRIFLKVLTRPGISKTCGLIMDSKISKIAIKPFINKNNIDITEYEDREYLSYNDFFTRKIKKDHRHINNGKNSLIAPCDSKMTAYKIDDNSYFSIKGSYYTISELLKNEELAEKYKGGHCLIFRLSVDDYHRYCYIDDGYHSKNIYIKGVLHTVRPIALEKYNIYKENAREYTVLQTANFGDVTQVEIGALMIGRIKNLHDNYQFSKGEEKGMFEFGGSTIALLFEKDKVVIDEEILHNTRHGYETVVKLGMKIGSKK